MATACANRQPNGQGLTPVQPRDPLVAVDGVPVRNHRNGVRNRSELLSAFNRNSCPPSSESAASSPAGKQHAAGAAAWLPCWLAIAALSPHRALRRNLQPSKIKS